MLLGTDPGTKLPPTFFIGLGGSGGRVVDVLARRLAAESSFARFEDLVHFVVVDTDQNDLARLHGRILKSNIATAHKPRRIALHRGEAAGTAEDRRVTSWVHPWYRFREHSNAGAGQIRLEARYSLHCQLAEQPPQNVEQLVRKGLARALRAQLPNRGSERVRVHLFASTAGGTGSGASLVMAALVRRLAHEAGAEVEVFGHFFLPSLFRDKVAPPLVPKIDANGYAALKEIERAQELRYEGGPEAIELVFHPGATQGKQVSPTEDGLRTAPFDWVYVLDRPEAMSIEEIYAAAGEAAYLQLFSPILGYQEREADNFRQLQTRLAAGYFALQNGSIGASVIELPRRRLERYFARRWTIGVLERFVVSGDGSARLSPEELATLSDTEQGRRLDQAFVTFVDAEARREEQDKKPGIFAEIARFESQGTQVLTALRKALEVELQKAEDLVTIDSINAAAMTPESYSLNAARDGMARDFQRSRQALSQHAAALERELASGQWLGRFFEAHKVSPLLQRRLLVEIDRLAREELRADLGPDEAELMVDWVLNPYEDPEAGRHLALRPPDPASYRVDTPEIRKQIETLEAGLGEAARKVFRKDQAFSERRQVAVSFFNQLRDTARDALVVELWQRVMRALQAQVQQRLDVFRVIARQGMGLVAHLAADAERCRVQGLEVPETDGAATEVTREFHLGSEVFHDERRGVRCWDAVWQVALAPSFHVPTHEVLAIVNRHLQASSTDDAKRQDGLSRVLAHIAKDLDHLGRARVAHLMSVERPLTLADGLVLEARLAALGHRVADPDRLAAVPSAEVVGYLREKVARVSGMSRALGRFDEPVLAGREFSPYRPRFFGVAADHLRASPLLGDALAMAAPGFERLEDWTSPDVVSFYQATLGVPLYAWLEVQGPLARAYEHQVADPGRHEPLHVDHRWEPPGFHDAPGPGLPGLDPVRRRQWEETQASRRDRALGAFARALAAGLVTRAADGAAHRWAWAFRAKTGELGASLTAALGAWAGLSEAIARPLADAADALLAERPARVDEALTAARGWRFDAEADGRVTEAQALGLLVAALEGAIAARATQAAA
ncbi:MAG: hypothetical protein IT385_12190 [Deltaproteobacteria bacterium]|nr:hypothetical protein [Deltaproteobacteria bacterium]